MIIQVVEEGEDLVLSSNSAINSALANSASSIIINLLY